MRPRCTRFRAAIEPPGPHRNLKPASSQSNTQCRKVQTPYFHYDSRASTAPRDRSADLLAFPRLKKCKTAWTSFQRPPIHHPGPAIKMDNDVRLSEP